ncbi:MAG: hypothetical protein KIT31_24500, partial [Deltaproteobacteria bacterium]|nr:hypothetical protein [Deltaproteobacteria bacterium]
TPVPTGRATPVPAARATPVPEPVMLKRPEPVIPAGERPSFSDFASRLDFGEESDMHPPPPRAIAQYERRTAAPLDSRLEASAGEALAAFDDLDDSSGFERPVTALPASRGGAPVRPIYDDDGSTSYTQPGQLPPPDFAPELEFDAAHAAFTPLPSAAEFDSPHVALTKIPTGEPNPVAEFDSPDAAFTKIPTGEPGPSDSAEFDAAHAAFTPIASGRKPPPGLVPNEPRILRPSGGASDFDRPTARPDRGAPRTADELDLESALEALDVDLDDLSVPHASTELVRDSGNLARPSGRVAIRSSKPGAKYNPAPAPAPTPAPTPRRAHSDDEGILIDFDNDLDDD